jgi:thiol-disulfide isomerase/thioredoxin
MKRHSPPRPTATTYRYPMDLLPLLVVLGLVAVSTVIGLALRWFQGRVRSTERGTVVTASELPSDVKLGVGATLLQFSSDVCSPCRATHRVLHGIASEQDAVAHVDLNLTHRPDLARHFNIMQTPTTFILDARGVVRARIGGAVRGESIRAELDRILVPAA